MLLLLSVRVVTDGHCESNSWSYHTGNQSSVSVDVNFFGYI